MLGGGAAQQPAGLLAHMMPELQELWVQDVWGLAAWAPAAAGHPALRDVVLAPKRYCWDTDSDEQQQEQVAAAVVLLGSLPQLRRVGLSLPGSPAAVLRCLEGCEQVRQVWLGDHCASLLTATL